MRAELGSHEPLILRNALRALAPLPRLARVYPKADGGPGKQLADTVALIVRQCVHRVDQNCLQRVGRRYTQAVIDDRHQEGFRLA